MAGIRPVERWKPTPVILEKIRSLAIKGCTEVTISRQLGISGTRWRTAKMEFPEIQEIIDLARAEGEGEAAGYLWQILRNPEHKQHFSAICFYLKTQHGWRDNSREDDKPALPSGVQFNKKEHSDGTPKEE